jgi:spore germination protein GerM
MVRRTGRMTRKARAKRRRAITRTVLILALILVVAVAIWWFHRPKEPRGPAPRPTEEAYITLFFPDSSDMYLIPAQRKIRLGKKENVHLRALKELRDGPREDVINLLPALPAGCNVLSADVSGTTARVNFNDLTLDLLDETSEKWFFKSVVNTLCAFNEIDRVDFFFEGERLAALPQGTDVSGPRTPGDLNLSRAPLPEGETASATLHFLDASGRYLVPVTERLSGVQSRNTLVILALERLLDGPSDADGNYLKPLFNPGVTLREQEGVVETSGRLVVALTADDPANALAAEPEQVYGALLLTLRNLLKFNEFDVLINGESMDDLPGVSLDKEKMYHALYPNWLPESPYDNTRVDAEEGGGESNE